jgi:lon-related putative ATP-dependent protease
MVRELEASRLRRVCRAEGLGFATTAELDDLPGVLGQARAVEALEFALGAPHDGFNLFVLGPTGTGRHHLVDLFVERAAAARPAPPDWVYVHNFADERRPRALALPAGRGAELRAVLSALVEELQTSLVAAFESEDYQSRRQGLESELKARQERAFGELAASSETRGLALLRTPLGIAFVPARGGEILPDSELQKLGEEQRRGYERAASELQGELEKVLHRVPRWQREHRDRLRDLDREVAGATAANLLAEGRERFRDLPAVSGFFDEVERDIVRHGRSLAAGEPGAEDAAPAAGRPPAALRRYQVNLMVDHRDAAAAPVVRENNPSYQNLCGAVEHLPTMGTLVTDFTRVTPGALHRANGGYLVLDALELLRQPFGWDGLRRALRARRLRIETPAQAYGLIAIASLEPEPIPLDVKVILVGDRAVYYFLRAADPDFGDLFKVAADFAEELERTPDHELAYARLVATLARFAKVPPLQAAAVARVIEEAARRAADGERLSLNTGEVVDLLRESAYFCGLERRATISAADVGRAIRARERRADQVRERLQIETLRGTLRIATAGTAVGQVNGLSVLELGGFAFGHATRISARARLGEGEVVDIEREVELSGPIHSKGVLILAGFLGERYAAERPLSLAASLVFEQTYGGVEGDSASMAELCALLSAIGGLELKQGIAVTGSVDQHGGAQAVGGVNEKIEGFFDLCAARGLDGGQGAVVPAGNLPHLMLRPDVVEAVAAGVFHVWPVETVDQTMELLSGLPAGARGGDGRYPAGSVNGTVDARLTRLADLRRAFGASGKEREPEPAVELAGEGVSRTAR